MNAALPAFQTLSESHCLYPTTAGGEMVPTQCAARCQARMTRGLLTLIVWSSPILGHPPRLNSSCHNLQIIPCPGWLTISILSQKVGAIVQKPDVGAIRHGHHLVIHRVDGRCRRKLRGDFPAEIWF